MSGRSGMLVGFLYVAGYLGLVGAFVAVQKRQPDVALDVILIAIVSLIGAGVVSELQRIVGLHQKGKGHDEKD